MVAGIQRDETVQPHASPLPRIVTEDRVGDGRRLLQLIGSHRRVATGHRNTDCSLRCRRQRLQSVGGILGGDRCEPRRHRVARIDRDDRKVGPVESITGHCRRIEQSRRSAASDRTGARCRCHFAEHSQQLVAHFVGALEPILRLRCRALHQPAVQRVVLGEDRHIGGRRQRCLEGALVALELEDQRGQCSGDRVQIAGDRRAFLGDLGCLEPDGPVDRRLIVVDPPHATEVDQLQPIADLDDVGRLEVAVEQAERMEIRKRRQDLDDVRNRLIDRDRREAAGRFHPVLQDDVQRTPADVLHDDVRGTVGGRHEVVDLDDQRMFDLGEVLLLGDRGPRGVGIAGVQQALQHHPAIVDVAILSEVDPAHATVRQATGHLVLTADECAGRQLGIEVERGTALRAEAFRSSRHTLTRPTHWSTAHRAEALVLGDCRRVHQRLTRIGDRHRRDLREAGAEP